MLHLKRPTFFYSESKKYSYSDLPLWDFAFKRLYAVTLKFIASGVKVTELVCKSLSSV
jgi:hypothetical protein